MGLSGQLEDLPILDIIQLVAFSQKSGYLSVDGPLGSGGVLFANGFVRCCYSSSTIENLRAIGARGRAEPEELSRHNEMALRELARLREGTFEFDVASEEADRFEGIDITPFLDYEGWNAQRLLLELATGMDEDRRDAAALIAQSASPDPPRTDDDPGSDVVPLPAGTDSATGAEESREPAIAVRREAEPSADGATGEGQIPSRRESSDRGRDSAVVLVDDETFILDVLSKVLESEGYRVHSAEGPAAGLAIARERARAGEKLVVVMDLKMPTSAGDSFFGGFELADALNREGMRLPMLLMTEQLSKEARGQAVKLGISKVAFKPTLTKPNPDEYRTDLEAYAGEIVRQIDHLSRGPASSAENVSARKETAPPASRESVLLLDFVASMSAQILDPSNHADVTSIVLEVASKYVERCLLFLIRKDVAVGLAGFGFAENHAETKELAKTLKLRIADVTPLSWLVRNRKTFGPSSELEAFESSLYSEIERGKAREFILIPMLNNGEVITALYGDNGRTGFRLERPQGLELVMAQAGMALENALLHRKLRSQKTAGVSA